MKKLLLAGLLAFGMSASALAQGSPHAGTITIRGVVGSLDGNVLTVVVPIGNVMKKIKLAPNFRVQYLVKSSLSAIKPGSYVGSAALPGPNGTLRAIEVHYFAPGYKGAAFSRPYDLGSKSSMTNGNVENIAVTKVKNVNAQTLTIKIDNGEKTLIVTPSTPVVTYAVADASALVKGAHVIVRATRNPDGSLSSPGVNVGKDGLVPPM
jgi:hypothetical protein